MTCQEKMYRITKTQIFRQSFLENKLIVGKSSGLLSNFFYGTICKNRFPLVENDQKRKINAPVDAHLLEATKKSGDGNQSW